MAPTRVRSDRPQALWVLVGQPSVAAGAVRLPRRQATKVRPTEVVPAYRIRSELAAIQDTVRGSRVLCGGPPPIG